MKQMCSYLRLSLTDRCSFNCFYCGAGRRKDFLAPEDYLSPDELARLASLFVDEGIRHIRLTGGEPLLRPEVTEIAGRLSAIKGLNLLSMTTNGFLLADFLARHPKSGIRRFNISLDTLDRNRFRSCTGVDGLDRVLAGIEAAASCGITDVRLNVLLIRGFNEDEIEKFVSFGRKKNLTVRFIEYFSTQERRQAYTSLYVASEDVRDVIERSFGPLAPSACDKTSGPAQYGRLQDGGRVGFISSVTRFFCHECNRLRLTADGKLFPCLHAEHFLDVKTLLRQGAIDDVKTGVLRMAEGKSRYNKTVCSRFFEMSSIGG